MKWKESEAKLIVSICSMPKEYIYIIYIWLYIISSYFISALQHSKTLVPITNQFYLDLTGLTTQVILNQICKL
jgi:hypothetical protein